MLLGIDEDAGPQNRATRALAERDAASYGSRINLGQHGLVLGQCVDVCWIGIGCDAAMKKQAAKPPYDRARHSLDLFVRGRRQMVKARAPGFVGLSLNERWNASSLCLGVSKERLEIRA